MPLTSIRALSSDPNDRCSNDNENINSDGPCFRPPLDLSSWSTLDTTSAAESVGGEGGGSGYNPQNGYLFDEQWLSCVSDSEPNLKNINHLVQEFNFIYEIYTPVGESTTDVVLETLANFERNLSLGVSKSLGLAHCADSETQLSVARSSAGQWLRRSLTSLKNDHRFLSGDTTTPGVLAVSMMPKDEISESPCTSTVQTDESAVCSHVVGGMTAWISTADGASIPKDDVFFNAVESYITDDNSKYLENGLVHVEYIGELDATTYTKLGTTDVTSGPSSIGQIVGLALAGVIFVVASVGGVWLYRKKQSKNKDDVYAKSQVIVEDNLDIQPQETEEVASYADTSTKSRQSPSDLNSALTDSFDAKTADYKIDDEITDGELDRWITSQNV